MQINYEIGSELQVCVYDLENNLLESSPWFHNLVLDSGLAFLNRDVTKQVANGALSLDIGTYLNIGSGRSTVTVDQVGLDNYVNSARREAGNDLLYSAYDDTLKRWYFEVKTSYMFPAGLLVGNFTELGLSNKIDQDYFNRVLIKDANGDPTTVVMDASKWLGVNVRTKLYFIDNQRGQLTIRDAENQKTIGYTQYYTCVKPRVNDEQVGSYASLIPPHVIRFGVSTSELNVPVLKETSGMFYRDSLVDNGLWLAYNSAYWVDHEVSADRLLLGFRLGSPDGNGALKSLGMILYGLTRGEHCGYCFQLDEPIIKTEDTVLVFVFHFKFSRVAV